RWCQRRLPSTQLPRARFRRLPPTWLRLVPEVQPQPPAVPDRQSGKQTSLQSKKPRVSIHSKELGGLAGKRRLPGQARHYKENSLSQGITIGVKLLLVSPLCPPARATSETRQTPPIHQWIS